MKKILFINRCRYKKNGENLLHNHNSYHKIAAQMQLDADDRVSRLKTAKAIEIKLLIQPADYFALNEECNISLVINSNLI